MSAKPFVIALEEHYADHELTDTYQGLERREAPMVAERLFDLTERRLAEMDNAGIDMQVLSHNTPGLQKYDAEHAVQLAERVNDRLNAAILAHPDRFAGFACLPTSHPKAAADELERTVTRLGFKGAMINGLAQGSFLDDRKFWPIFERAQTLSVPIYLHPSVPHPAVVAAYYEDYAADWPIFLRSGWGFTVESATQAVRLVLSGVLDRYPETKIILGHLGEGLPFYLWRINNSLSRNRRLLLAGDVGREKGAFRDYFLQHFYITTSGFFSDSALQCCINEIGIEHILFSVDYPYEDNIAAVNWMNAAPLPIVEKEQIFSINAKRVLNI